MGILNGVKIEFEESMSGYIVKGQTDPTKGVVVGQREKTEIRFDVRIIIEDLGRFLKISDHQAALMDAATLCFRDFGLITLIDDTRDGASFSWKRNSPAP